MNSNFLKSIRIMYFALAAGILFFMLISIFINSTIGAFMGKELAPTEKAPYLIVLIFLTGGVLIAYKIITPKKLGAIKEMNGLESKLSAWRELYIIQGALVEGPSFFGIVLFLLLGVPVLLVWPVAGLVFLWLVQPTRDKLIEEAQISSADLDAFDRIG